MSKQIDINIDKISIALDNICSGGGTPNFNSINLLPKTDTIVVALSCYECYPPRVWTKGVSRLEFIDKYVRSVECNDNTDANENRERNM